MSDLAELLTPGDFLARHSNVFPSRGSLQWFVRAHRAELLKARAVVLVNRRRLIDPPRFAKVVRAVGDRAAKASA